MSQQVVESVIGRLACDEEYRERFALDRTALVDQLVSQGLPLTPVERRALLATDFRACEELAARLDPRIQKVDLRRTREWSLASPPSVAEEPDAAVGTLSDVVAFVDARPDNTGVAEFAASLAREHRAHLTGVLIMPEPRFNQHDSFVRGDAIGKLIAEHDTMRLEMETDRRRLVERVAGRHGIEVEWRMIPRFTNYDATVHVRCGDVAVIARSEAPSEHWGDRGLLDALILTSGRPLIVLPTRCPVSRMRRVLVGWNAKREAARAVADALPLLVKAEAVTVLVLDVEAGTVGPGDEPGAEVVQHLARHGAKVDVRRVSSGGENVGRLLLAQACAFGADLVVMGAYGRSRISEQVFGGVTHTVLREAELPVLVSH